MFIQTETTPNPSTLKFLPGKLVLDGDTRDYRSAEAAAESPLAEALFSIDGVEGVFLGQDFVAVSRTEAGPEWPHMKPAVLGAIMEHFTSSIPILKNGATGVDEEEFFDEGDEQIVDTIKELLDTRVRPAVAMDGGDISFKGYKDGVVFLNMRGACAGCPSSTATLQYGIQNLLRHFVPEVQEVRPVEAF